MKRICIATADRELSAALHCLLERLARYEVTAFADGLEALLTVRDAPPALLIVDVRLPLVDGLALTRLLKYHEETQSLPVLVVGALVEMEDAAREVGADGCVSRRVDEARVVVEICRLLLDDPPAELGVCRCSGAPLTHHPGSV